MKKILNLILVLLICVQGKSQTAADYYEKGEMQYNLKNYVGAIDAFTKAIELNPTYLGAILSRGIAQSKIKNYNDAITDFNKVIAVDPKCVRAYLERADAKASENYVVEARKDYSIVIDLDPKSFRGYLGRGSCLNMEAFAVTGSGAEFSQYNKAIADFTRAIELNAKCINAYLGRGLAKISIQQKDSGCLDLNKAAELGSKDAVNAMREYCQ
jgi:tetratricopeptide (TPR) repeat protein